MRLSADEVRDPLVVVDLVYGKEATELVAAARRGGAEVVDGLDILVHQGGESFRIWTGREPPLETMRRAIREQR
jgi:shikimate dehydrogenase